MGEGPREPGGWGGDGQMSKDEEGVKGHEPHHTARKRAGGTEGYMTGEGGPTLVKNRAAEKDGIF
jgi:hypothetical protein